jgi:hypothetical protein
MSNRPNKTKSIKHKESKDRPVHQVQKAKAPWQCFLSLGKLLGGIAVFVTLLGAYYAFSPKLLVTPSEPFDPANPFATSFDIRNDGLLNVYEIKSQLRVLKLSLKDEKGQKVDTPPGVIIRTSHPSIPRLASGETTSIFLVPPTSAGNGYLHIDLELVLFYQPALIPFEITKISRFITERASDGSWKWMKKAVSE